MRKTIYNVLATALANVSGVEHVGLWNNQLQYIEKEQPFNTPAVFVEFSPIQWQHLLHGVREAAVTVTLHVVTDSRVGTWADVINVFDLLDCINAALHGLHSVSPLGGQGGSVMDALTLTTSTTDHNFDELRDDVETYQCHVTDNSGYGR